MGDQMVREVLSKSSEIPLRSVSLSADDLLTIIESKHFEKVTARNDGMVFDSFEDMKKNKALLAGQPNVDCGDISISFDSYLRRVWIYKFTNESFGLAKSIAAEITQRKTIFDRAKDKQKYFMIPLFLIMVSSSLGPLAVKTDDQNYLKYLKNISDYSIIPTVLFITLYTIFYYMHYIRKTVYYRPTEGFLRRNLEKIIVAVVCTALGIGIKALFDRL
ncbi:hypothetical protein [Mesorhizobium sp. M0276]|uniref:hypothetical protein n=1 Tax=Mesorhizobium sp. M0276 TaxID=2956928 RepID=UPI0033377A4F